MPSPAAPPIADARMLFCAQCSSTSLSCSRGRPASELNPAQPVYGAAAPLTLSEGLRPIATNNPLILSQSLPSPGSPSQPPQLSISGPSGASPAAFHFGLIASVARIVNAPA